MVKMLQRVEAEQAEEEQFEITDDKRFAQEAKMLLGYSMLETENASQIRKQAHQTSMLKVNAKLVEILKELDIRPFSKKSVEAYKTNKIKKLKRRDHTSFAMFVFGVVLVVSSIVLIFASAAKDNDGGDVLSDWWAIPGILMAICSIPLIGLNVPSDRKRYEWTQTKIAFYGRPIPEFAIQTAIDIKKRLPEAYFEVEELTERRVVDPFLVVSVEHGPDYYIEVWNEPGFKQERTA